MPVSQADIDNLNAAIASGTRSVTLGDQTVIYNTTASLIQARDDMISQLAKQTQAATGAKGRPAQTYGYNIGRGYN